MPNCVPCTVYRVQRKNQNKRLFFLRVWLESCFFIILACGSAWALNLDNLKLHFLSGDFKLAILEGERVLASATAADTLDELYYILGLSYIKDGNYLRASDIFEIIINEIKGSRLKEEARLGLGDSYLLRGDFDRSLSIYRELLNSNPQARFKPMLYYRLSQACIKKGQTEEAKQYLGKLKNEFPLSPETGLDNDLYAGADIFYSVQVGSFTAVSNARNLCVKLAGQGYDAYVQEARIDGQKTYRVKVGKTASRAEAVQLSDKLFSEGYPTKIIP